MRSTICRYIAFPLIFILLFIQPVYAHGVTYETKQTGANKIRITLGWSTPSEAKGIAITYFYLKNGKTLNVGYEINDKAPVSTYMDFDLTGAVPPIRIVLNNVSDQGAAPFDDIKNIEAEEYIRHLHDAGIINGRSGNLFEPDATITRAEFMVLVVKALKFNDTADSVNSYSDINNHWAKGTILTAAKHGLISGYGDGTIRPDNPITVAEVSAVIAKAFTFKTNRNGIYSKLQQNKWYSSYIKKIFDTGILNVSDSIYNNFDGQSLINRANCAMMISRALSTY